MTGGSSPSDNAGALTLPGEVAGILGPLSETIDSHRPAQGKPVRIGKPERYH